MHGEAAVMAIATAACLATLAGGALALRFRDHLHLLLGFSAGAVIAVALFDLLPEALNLARTVSADAPQHARQIEASVGAFVEHAIGKMVTICRSVRVARGTLSY